MDTKLAAIIVHDIKNSLGVLEGELRALTMESDSKRAALAHLTCLGLQEKLIGFLTLYKASSQGLIAQIEAISPEDFFNSLLRHLTVGKASLEVSINRTDLPVIAFSMKIWSDWHSKRRCKMPPASHAVASNWGARPMPAASS